MMNCLICKHDADNMHGDIGHIMHGFKYSEERHEITYPSLVNECTFYICIRCTDQLRKLITNQGI